MLSFIKVKVKVPTSRKYYLAFRMLSFRKNFSIHENVPFRQKLRKRCFQNADLVVFAEEILLMNKENGHFWSGHFIEVSWSLTIFSTLSFVSSLCFIIYYSFDILPNIKSNNACMGVFLYQCFNQYSRVTCVSIILKTIVFVTCSIHSLSLSKSSLILLV